MAEASVRWIANKTFVGTDSTRHSVVLSTPDDGVGMKPSELLLIALASCTAVDVVTILAKKRAHLTGLEIKASAEQDPEPPWTFRRIHLQYRLKGRGLADRDVEQAIQLSEDKYCSVASTLRGAATITTGFEILQEE